MDFETVFYTLPSFTVEQRSIRLRRKTIPTNSDKPLFNFAKRTQLAKRGSFQEPKNDKNKIKILKN